MTEIAPKAGFESVVLDKVKKEVEVVSTVYDIFEKIKMEGHGQLILEALKGVISNEISFALNQLRPSINSMEPADLKRQIITNSYIFKENLKIICTIFGGLTS